MGLRPIGSRFGLCAALAGLPGCYEIEPEIAKDYVGSPAQPGWPAPAVYSSDPFHPANRIFQRLFVLGEEPAAAIGTDPPFSMKESLSAIDRAELAALLDALAKGGDRSPPLGMEARLLLETDILAFLLRLESKDSFPKGTELMELALRGKPEPASLPRSNLALPPPLRDGSWAETDGPRAAGLVPSASDFRWTRSFRGAGRAALVRLRIAAKEDGEPVLLQLGSEAWLLDAAGQGPPLARGFYFRRTRLLRGEEPWEEVPAGAALALRHPEKPAAAPISGELRAVCASCHPGPGLDAKRESLPLSGAPNQAEAARAVLSARVRGRR